MCRCRCHACMYAHVSLHFITTCEAVCGVGATTHVPAGHVRVEALNVVVLKLLVRRGRVEHVDGADGDEARVVGAHLRHARVLVQAPRHARQPALHADDEVRPRLCLLRAPVQVPRVEVGVARDARRVALLEPGA